MTDPKTQAALGGGLILTPTWATWLHTAAGVAGDIAAFLGLFIAAHAVWRILRRRR